MRHVLLLQAVALGLLAASSSFAADATVTNASPNVLPWDTSAQLGATLTRGNSDTMAITAQIQANKKFYQNEINLGADAVYGENNGVRNAGAAHGFAQYNRLFTERFFGYFRVEGLHDDVAKIDYRVSLSPGVGYYFIKEKNLTLRGEVGPGYVFERLDGVSNDYATLRLAERGEWKINDRAKIWESVEILPQVDKFKNYVINSEIGVDTAITKKLSQVTFLQDTFRSEPAPGRKKNDLKLVAGIKYKF